MASSPRPEAPGCPKCQTAMIIRRRRSDQAEFWGCPTYPQCDGTRRYIPNAKTQGPKAKAPEPDGAPRSKSEYVRPKPKVYPPIVKMDGSDEQEAIWEYMLDGSGHMMIDAYAGVGKTHTMIQGCLREPKSLAITFVAFNKHIALEAQGKLKASGCDNVRALTYHGLGMRTVMSHYPQTRVNPDKLEDILELIEPNASGKEWFSIKRMSKKLVGLAKSYLLDYKAADFADELEYYADHHGLDLDGDAIKGKGVKAPAVKDGKRSAMAMNILSLVPQIMEECEKSIPVHIDYDDMIWAPELLDLGVSERIDMLITDEVQDLGSNQQRLAFRAGFRARMLFVGDRHQAIYGWRGSDTAAIDNLVRQLQDTDLGLEQFPLTTTYRCPKSHVALVNGLVPQIRATEDAPEGEIVSKSPEDGIAMMQPGDMAVCRVNAGLIPTAYALIRRGIKPVIRGRQIGSGLLELIARLLKECVDEDDIGEFKTILLKYRTEQEQRLIALGGKGEGRLQSLHDKCDCLTEFILNCNTVTKMKDNITAIFADFDPDGTPKEAVVLGTVHRTKGLEAHRVFILSPELMPHPMARKDWAREQENNIAYIAGTRAKYEDSEPGTLIFCGPIPAIYAAPTLKKA